MKPGYKAVDFAMLDSTKDPVMFLIAWIYAKSEDDRCWIMRDWPEVPSELALDWKTKESDRLMQVLTRFIELDRSSDS